MQYYELLEAYYLENQTDIREVIDKDFEGVLFEYCVRAIMEHSQDEANRDTFTEFLEVCGDLVDSDTNNNHLKIEKHYHWDGDALMLFWSAIWNRYAKHVGPQDAAAGKSHITKCLDELDLKGKRHNVNWKPVDGLSPVRQKGYRIEDAITDARLVIAFNGNWQKHEQIIKEKRNLKK